MCDPGESIQAPNTHHGFGFHLQDTLIGLRHQLDEVKVINVEMYQKMQVKTRLTWLHSHCNHRHYLRLFSFVSRLTMR